MEQIREKLFLQHPGLNRTFILNNLADDFENETQLGKCYELSSKKDIRKEWGRFYTPCNVVNYMVSCTLSQIDVLENPFVRILDPACGAGYFLTASFDFLYDKFLNALKDLRSKYNDTFYLIGDRAVKGQEYWCEDNIGIHILKYCLYGFDKDETAIFLTKYNLLKKAERYTELSHIYLCDSLLNDIDKNLSFDYILGNPPYIGHKSLSKSYKDVLRTLYKDIYSDKADISYCFLFKYTRPELLKRSLCFITSRYFLEAKSAAGLRSELSKLGIDFILDFYGTRVLKGIGIDPIIIKLDRDFKEKSIKVRRVSISNYKYFDFQNEKADEIYWVNRKNIVSSDWKLFNSREKEINSKVELKCTLKLEDMMSSFQGVITGCDKAFIVTKEEADLYKIEKEYLRKWIKSSEISRYYTYADNEKFLIYVSGEINRSSNAYKYLEMNKEKILRRKSLDSKRDWFILHRSRDEEKFTETKIIFPYKSSRNIFSINKDGSFFSADVYGLKGRLNTVDEIYMKGLCALLNSSLYEYYFKSFGKKLGDKLYEYYPNTLMKLSLPPEEFITELGSVPLIQSESSYFEKEINLKVCDYFNINL